MIHTQVGAGCSMAYGPPLATMPPRRMIGRMAWYSRLMQNATPKMVEWKRSPRVRPFSVLMGVMRAFTRICSRENRLFHMPLLGSGNSRDDNVL